MFVVHENSYMGTFEKHIIHYFKYNVLYLYILNIKYCY